MEKDMKIESMYDVNDKVWFYHDQDGKFYEGTVVNVSNWDKFSGFRYEVRHNGSQNVNNNVQESKLYASKNYIIENCFVEEA